MNPPDDWPDCKAGPKEVTASTQKQLIRNRADVGVDSQEL